MGRYWFEAQEREEICEALGVGLEVGWKLEEQQAQLAGRAYGFERGDELSHVVARTRAVV